VRSTSPSLVAPFIAELPIAAGWIERDEERDEDKLDRSELTAEGRRRSTSWRLRRPVPKGVPALVPFDDEVWCVPAAHFDRTGRIEITDVPRDRWPIGYDDIRGVKNVTLRGRWVPTEDGRLLQRAGWRALDADQPTRLEQMFVFHGGAWVRMDHLTNADRWHRFFAGLSDE
jgi:hypothetical protein